MKRTITTLTAVALLAGCASTARVYQPIVDPKIGDQAALPEALAECRDLAQQIGQADRAAGGAVVGAVLGLAVGAMFGLRGQNLAALSGSTALLSGVRSAEYAGLNQEQVIARCLANRGYSVLR
jgi:uncharacterized protein YcfJ